MSGENGRDQLWYQVNRLMRKIDGLEGNMSTLNGHINRVSTQFESVKILAEDINETKRLAAEAKAKADKLSTRREQHFESSISIREWLFFAVTLGSLIVAFVTLVVKAT